MAGISKKRIKTKKGEKIKYVVSYRDITGKQHTSGGYETKKEAERHKAEFERQKPSGTIPTIGEILNTYIDICIKKNRAGNTIKDYKKYINNHLKPYLDVKYNKILPVDWQNIIFDISNNVSVYAGIGCHRLLRAAINYNLKFNLVSVNNFQCVEPPDKPIVSHQHFEVEEMLNLLNESYKSFPDFYALLFTFMGAGMREGELFGFLKENFLPEKNIIRVRTQYTSGEFKDIPKGKNHRDVYIFPTLTEVICTHIENDKTDSPLVFHNSEGGFLNPSNVRNRFWLPLLKLCGYPKNYARMHDLRGSYTDLASVLGLAVTFSQNQLGHTSPTTTLQYYNQMNKAMIKDGVQKFEQVFQKCEQNVSQKQKSNNCKIIQFPKKQAWS